MALLVPATSPRNQTSLIRGTSRRDQNWGPCKIWIHTRCLVPEASPCAKSRSVCRPLWRYCVILLSHVTARLNRFKTFENKAGKRGCVILKRWDKSCLDMIDIKKQFSFVYFRKVIPWRTHHFIAFQTTEMTTTLRASFPYRKFVTSVSVYFLLSRNSFKAGFN